MEPDARVLIDALHHSHDRLNAVVRSLSGDQLRGRSYCADWSVAQVLSHLGSGAEISLIRLTAALGDAELPEQAVYQQIWATWDTKSPDAMAADALAADMKHIDALERLSDDQLAAISLPMFGMELDAADLIRLRLSEHVLHTWDVQVTVDKAAVLPAEAAALLIDSVPAFVAPRSGRPLAQPFEARIITTSPPRDYLLTATDAVRMADWDGTAAKASQVTTLDMPAESLLRLTSGRLDPAHTPQEVAADPAALGALRQIFPGF